MSQTFDIHQRIFKWVVAVLKFLDKVPRTIKTTPIISQLANSITSVGANDREANSAETTKDFCHKYGLTKKEADESVYWLLIIGELYPHLKAQVDELWPQSSATLSKQAAKEKVSQFSRVGKFNSKFLQY